MKAKQKFNVGDAVQWKSQAGGSTTTKKGTVVRVIHQYIDVAPYNIAIEEFPNHISMFDGVNIPGNSLIGYFVEVTDRKRKPRLYMPYQSKLTAVSPPQKHASSND